MDQKSTSHRTCGRLVSYFFYWAWHAYCSSTALWHIFEGKGEECSDPKPDLPVNRSGVKVLVYGLSKTGTRTMSRSLYQVGLKQSYHSEELSLHVWSPLADEYWLRPENGGRRAGTSHGIYAFLGLTNLNREYSNDTAVLLDLKQERLAQALAGCKVDAIAFDGMENLFWPIYKVSPGVKVLILDWRTYEGWHGSRSVFAPMLMLQYIFGGMLQASIMAGPYLLLVWPLDRITGGHGAELLRTGSPPAGQDIGPLRSLTLSVVGSRRVTTHLYAGLKVWLVTPEQYNNFYKIPYSIIPADRRMSWDMRKNTWEDLCKFVGVPPKDCPSKGLLPRAVNVLNFERDFPLTFLATFPWYLVLHRVNWYVYTCGIMGFAAVGRFLCRCGRPGN